MHTLIALSLLLLAACTKNISDKSVDIIDVQQMAKLHARDAKSVLIIDSRSPEDFAAGHIPGARNIRLPQIRENDRDPALERYKQIIVYGQNPGSATAMAIAKRLLASGYSDVVLFKPGFDAWKASGMSVEPLSSN